jgi:hypothetical protein
MTPVEQHPELLSLDEKDKQRDSHKKQAGKAFEEIRNTRDGVSGKKQGEVFLLPEKMPGKHKENISQPGEGDINQPVQRFVKDDPSVSDESQGIDQGNAVAEFLPGKDKNRYPK